MQAKTSFRIATLMIGLGLASACSGDHHGAHDHAPLEAAYEGSVRGDANGQPGVEAAAFVKNGPNGVLIQVDVTGLTPGFHGVHLHQVGRCDDADDGFKASGKHINPSQNAHGLLNPDGFELADLPNIYAHDSGHARAELFAGGADLDDLLDADGFALVVHENADDHRTQPIGGAGPRVACIGFTR